MLPGVNDGGGRRSDRRRRPLLMPVPSDLKPVLPALTAADADWQAVAPGCGSDRSSSAPPPRRPSTCVAIGRDDHNRHRSWWGDQRGGAWGQPGSSRQNHTRLGLSTLGAARGKLPRSCLWPTTRRCSPSSLVPLVPPFWVSYGGLVGTT